MSVLKTCFVATEKSNCSIKMQYLCIPGSGSEILTPNASLSSIEIEALLREKVRARADNIRQVILLILIKIMRDVQKNKLFPRDF